MVFAMLFVLSAVLAVVGGDVERWSMYYTQLRSGLS